MSEPVPIKLLCRAGDALIAWRRRWERQYGNAPSVGDGNGDEIRIWKVAGELMKSQGIKRKLP